MVRSDVNIAFGGSVGSIGELTSTVSNEVSGQNCR
jgi:hypothetical protein